MSKLEIQLAVEKVSKYASSESGDTVEVIERPHGGISVVVADGQRSGRSAKHISNIVVRKAISLLAEGVRDGAVARATHDYLHTQRSGKVSAELFIVSVDLVTQTLVVSRNARCPTLLRTNAEFVWLDEPSEAVGIYRNTKPAIVERALEPNLTLVVFTDGIWRAGDLAGDDAGARIDIPALLTNVDADGSAASQAIADAILAEALRLDHGRPRDDATVLVLKLVAQAVPDDVRRLSMRFPI
jgi:serine phosphatase RsbU (regulator of sigma subunit)